MADVGSHENLFDVAMNRLTNDATRRAAEAARPLEVGPQDIIDVPQLSEEFDLTLEPALRTEEQRVLEQSPICSISDIFEGCALTIENIEEKTLDRKVYFTVEGLGNHPLPENATTAQGGLPNGDDQDEKKAHFAKEVHDRGGSVAGLVKAVLLQYGDSSRRGGPYLCVTMTDIDNYFKNGVVNWQIGNTTGEIKFDKKSIVGVNERAMANILAEKVLNGAYRVG